MPIFQLRLSRVNRGPPNGAWQPSCVCKQDRSCDASWPSHVAVAPGRRRVPELSAERRRRAKHHTLHETAAPRIVCTSPDVRHAPAPRTCRVRRPHVVPLCVVCAAPSSSSTPCSPAAPACHVRREPAHGPKPPARRRTPQMLRPELAVVFKHHVPPPRASYGARWPC